MPVKVLLKEPRIKQSPPALFICINLAHQIFYMRIVLILISFFISSVSLCQAPKSYTSSEIFQQIKKLNVLGSVLYVAAHPDDENTRLLAFLSNEKLYNTGYLSMTRGDGGQNLIGDEQGVALGLIRTQELLSARSIDGAKQFFTRAFDFGYTKSPKETFEFWDEQKILSDVVWVIRKFQPDVIITRFPTTGEGGHGHHTASAILAGEAFDAAGDPSKFPEQFKFGLKPWKPKRLLWNTFNFGSVNTTSDNQFKINAGGYNPLLGESYGEIAAHSRSQHKSQGFGVSSSRGVQYEYFKTIKGDAPQQTLMDGVVTNWERMGQPQITTEINLIEKSFSFQHPENSVPALLKLYNRLKDMKGYWPEKKADEVKHLIAACSGLFMEAYTRNEFAVQGDSLKLILSVDNRLGVPVTLKSFMFLKENKSQAENLPADVTLNKELNVLIPQDQPISQPYWLKYPMSKGSFTVPDQQLIGKPENDPLTLKATFDFDGTLLNFDIPVKYKYNDPVKGEIYEPLFVIPSIEIRSEPELALSLNQKPVAIKAYITQNIDTSSGLKFDLIKTFDNKISEVSKNGNNYYFLKSGNETDTLHFSANTNSGTFNKYKVLIRYPHIPQIVYFPEAKSALVNVDLKVSGKTAGYIPGAGDKIPDALEKMGYSVTTLSPNDFTASTLSKFDVIVSGVRAYNIHTWLNDVYPALMNYVKEGGVLLVQYNTNNNIGPVKAKIGPYPFQITRTRVTDEQAAVTFVQPNDKLLHFPNEITQKDFNNWIQERSTYHAAEYGDHYKTLFSMHDEGESPQEGGLIYCDYGKGRFIYSGLVFFRELPAGVPGAYRLFANLIAKPGS